MHEITPRASLRGAAHPGQHDIGIPRRDDAPEAESSADIERPAKPQLRHCHASLPQTPQSVGIAPDQNSLVFAHPLQCADQPHKEGFGPAMLRSGHRLQQPPAHAIKASKRPATMSQLSPR